MSLKGMYIPQANHLQMKMGLNQPEKEFLPTSLKSLLLSWV